MKIDRRVIQERNISINNERRFVAKYKKHDIDVRLDEAFPNGINIYDVRVWDYKGGVCCDTLIHSCTMDAAIAYALNGALL